MPLFGDLVYFTLFENFLSTSIPIGFCLLLAVSIVNINAVVRNRCRESSKNSRTREKLKCPKPGKVTF